MKLSSEYSENLQDLYISEAISLLSNTSAQDVYIHHYALVNIGTNRHFCKIVPSPLTRSLQLVEVDAVPVKKKKKMK